MGHPFKGRVSDGKAKAKAMCYASGGTVKNLTMSGPAAGYKKVEGSTGNLQQHKDQNAAPGMKCGGRLDKTARNSSAGNSPGSRIAKQAGGGVLPSSPPATYAAGGAVKLKKYPINAGAASGKGRLELSKKSKAERCPSSELAIKSRITMVI